MKQAVPTGVERFFAEDEIIVSKTDVHGVITYANQVFLKVAGYSESEVIGKPHNIIRHPDMPRCVFKLLWDTISQGEEIFALVINLCKNGDHYWVLAHVTPTFDERGKIVGYHSSRRVPEPSAVTLIKSIYQELLAVENSNPCKSEGMARSGAALIEKLESLNITYPEFIFSLV